MKKETAEMLLKAYQKKDWEIVASVYESVAGKPLPVPTKFTIDYDWRESDNSRAIKES